MHDIIQAIILGIVQGLTEFIPVSSSGHLVIGEAILNTGFSNLTYDVVLHFGTLVALLVYFRREIAYFFRNLANPESDRRLLGYLAVATIPTVVAGFFFYDAVNLLLRSLWLVVVMLVVVALLMFVADRRGGQRALKDMTLRDAIIIGLAQTVSLIPGTSRAGSTIVAGSLLKFNNAVAAKFSFYMAVPVIFGANLRVALREGIFADIAADWLPYLVGTVVAGAVGYMVIAFLLNYLRDHKLAVFAWYRIGLAVVLAIVLVI